MYTEIEAQAIAHGQEQYPKESLGIVVNNSYIALENKSNERNTFILDNHDYFKYFVNSDSKPSMVYHSHPYEGEQILVCYPSFTDMQCQLTLDVPFGIVNVDKEHCYKITYFGDGLPIPDYEKRTFLHGVTDCYALVRDYYKKDMGVILPQFPRSWDWWSLGYNMILDNYVQAGCVEVPLANAKKGDIIVMSLGRAAVKGCIPNHSSIYLGDELILHHIAGSSPYDTTHLSCIDVIGRYVKYIHKCFRYNKG